MTNIHVPHTRHVRRRMRPLRPNRRRKFARWLNQVSDNLDSTGTASPVTSISAGALGDSASNGEFTFTGAPAEGETITIGAVTYTFSETLNAANRILLTDDQDEAVARLIGAANGVFKAGEAHPDTVALVQIEAIGVGLGVVLFVAQPEITGSTVATTDTIANGSWGAATLQGSAPTGDNGLTRAAHGLSSGDGPYRVSSVGTLPAGLSEDTLYWVHVRSVTEFTLHLNKGDAVQGAETVVLQTAGAGTMSLTPATTPQSIVEYIRNGVATSELTSETDVDDIVT